MTKRPEISMIDWSRGNIDPTSTGSANSSRSCAPDFHRGANVLFLGVQACRAATEPADLLSALFVALVSKVVTFSSDRESSRLGSKDLSSRAIDLWEALGSVRVARRIHVSDHRCVFIDGALCQ